MCPLNRVQFITYLPPHISKITLDLRYIVSKDDSLARKRLDIVLLVCIHFDPNDPPRIADDVITKFGEDLYNLISLHFNQYEFRVEPLNGKEDIDQFRRPFKAVKDIVEITRRVIQNTPFEVSSFEGNSPMTKIVDMMLLEKGQCCYSVLLEPFQLTKDEQEKMEAYGYRGKMLPPRLDKEIELALNEAMPLEFGSMTQPMFASFRMKIRLFSDNEISQYLVNLVGSEISGRGDFMPLQRLKSKEFSKEFNKEVEYLETLHFNPLFHKVVKLNVPPDLLNLIYLFRPKEAISAFRFPTERISVSKEKMFRTYNAPINHLPTEGLLIGEGLHPSYRGAVEVKLQPLDRKRHMYIVGKTGTGKSMMVLSLAIQDIEDGKGLCLIDPHGDLVEALFAHIPQRRKDDVYLFDPSDTEYAVGFNFLETESDSEREKDYIIQEVISMLLRTVEYNFEMFGPIAQQWTRYGCMTMMDLPKGSALGGTLLEVPRLFTDKNFRERVLKEITNPLVKIFWEDEYNNMSDFHKSEMMGYFTSKFTPLVSAPQIRNIIGQTVSGFNFKKIMDQKKILLVNLSSGKIGRKNSELLGGTMVSRLLWSAMTRAWQAEEKRQEFYLYVDEFQNFITDTFEIILSEARKYGLNLIIAHQHLAQLEAMGKLGNKLERAVFGNVGTMIVFRTGSDADKLADELGEPVQGSTLRNLENRYAVTKLLVNNVPTVPFTMKTVDFQFPSQENIDRGKEIKEFARKRGKLIIEVEEEIRRRYNMD